MHQALNNPFGPKLHPCASCGKGQPAEELTIGLCVGCFDGTTASRADEPDLADEPLPAPARRSRMPGLLIALAIALVKLVLHLSQD